MKKILLSLLLLALAIPAWSGEQTITISRKDGQFNTAEGVYYVSKGGVTMTMSGGMNNSNFLVLRHMNTVTFKSANFAIKKIIFHCLDDFTSNNLDVFYWGPTTMNVMTVNYKPAGSSTTTAVTPGKFTASGYDGTWTSDFTGTWTSNFRTTDGSTTETRTHTKFTNGWPAGNSLIFGSLGKPVRFSSIDIVIEKEDGDIYDLVKSIDQVQDGHNYLIVNWENAKALSVNTTEGKVAEQVHTGSPVEFISGHVDNSGLYDQYAKIKTDGEAQIIKFEKYSLPISNSSGPINNDRPWLLNAGGNYLRITSSANSSPSGNIGPDLYGVSTINDEWSYAKVEIGNQSYGYNARIRYRVLSSTSFPRPTSSGYRIAYNQTNNYFRDLEYSSTNTNTEQNIRLYTPAQNYNVTTEVRPDASKGSISLRDGVIVSDETATSGTSQQYETVSFLVNPANGYKISNVTIQAGTSTIEPENVTLTTNGTLYTYVMPASDVHIIAEFAEVQYHNIYTYVKPKSFYGNIFLTEGYVVQENQVKSFEGQNIVFNVMANLKDITNENNGYYELSYVTYKIGDGEEITIPADQLGNYNFTMPDDDVTITAYFYDDTKTPLYLLGTDNGNAWHSYGPRFNYDDETDEYYIDVYYKGNGNYGDSDGYAYGEFSVTWRIDMNDNWDNINNHGWRGVPYDNDYEMTEQYDYGLSYDNYHQNNHFKIKAGIYRIKVGTQASQDKGYLQLNHLAVVKTPITLTFDPAGGATAAEAVEVPQGQVVTLNGDLYNKIKAINPDEADANFYYKTVETIDGTTPETNTANGTTTGSASLDVVNDGETVTQLEGWNYLGWIVADNEAYYKVISTPLAWIEENGDPGKTYTVADKLQIVYVQEYDENTQNGNPIGNISIWAKDLPTDDHPEGLSIDKTFQADGQIDYMMSSDYTARPGGIWDQSNWIELDLSELSNNPNVAVGDYIEAGTLKGEYIDGLNYKMKVSEMSISNNGNYIPNTYCTVNFLEDNLMLRDNSTGPYSNVTNKYYYFLNPKIQEYVKITYAMWDKVKQIFVVPAQSDVDNANDFDGALRLGGWNYNIASGETVLAGLDADQNASNVYEFYAIVRRNNSNYGHFNEQMRSNPTIKPDQTASENICVMPIDLQVDENHVITAVRDVNTASHVISVEYVNVAGLRSHTPWQGMNIVVTHYADGTISAKKVIR